jgi:histidinol-phosphate phosphatase family protein
VDRSLVADTTAQDDWSLDRLHALAQPRAIEFPGSRPLQAALLDRDGTIIEEQGYVSDPEEVTLLPGAAAGLRALASRGIRLVVVTNQSGVGRGRISPSQLGLVHRRLGDLLAAEGVTLDGIYSCVHSGEFACECRKPAPGLARRAAADLGLALDRTVVAGDKPADLMLARTLGVPGFLVTTGYGVDTLREENRLADYVVDDLDQLARICCHPAGLALPAALPPA